MCPRLLIRPRTPLAAARLVWRAKRLYRPVSDIMQIGGDFMVGREDIIICFARSSEDPTDRPEVAEFLRLIGSLR